MGVRPVRPSRPGAPLESFSPPQGFARCRGGAALCPFLTSSSLCPFLTAVVCYEFPSAPRGICQRHQPGGSLPIASGMISPNPQYNLAYMLANVFCISSDHQKHFLAAFPGLPLIFTAPHLPVCLFVDKSVALPADFSCLSSLGKSLLRFVPVFACQANAALSLVLCD